MRYKKYRIVRNHFYNCFKVQCWRIWFPFWVEIHFCSVESSLEEAKEALKYHKNPIIYYEE